MKKAYFIISTGRCGTQWLADYLQKGYSEAFRIEHEPLHNDYQPRKMIGFRDPLQMEKELPQATRAHFHKIKRQLESKHYIECGHPNWSTLPYFINKLRKNVCVIHLVRHPVPTAYSWLTHRAYCPSLAFHLKEKVLLSPNDEGVLFPEYKEKWNNLNPFEKALYYWVEVNAFALQLEKETDIPWLRLKFEDLFLGNGLKGLIKFLEIENNNGQTNQKSIVDNFCFVTDTWYDWRSIENHPRVLELAAKFDYNLKNINNGDLLKRYVTNI